MIKLEIETNGNILNEKLRDDLDKLANDLNALFKDSNDNIKKLINKEFNIKTRDRKLSFVDALCYYFNYSFIILQKYFFKYKKII